MNAVGIATITLKSITVTCVMELTCGSGMNKMVTIRRMPSTEIHLLAHAQLEVSVSSTTATVRVFSNLPLACDPKCLVCRGWFSTECEECA